MARILAQPSGVSRAPGNSGCVVRCAGFLARGLPALSAGAFVDDVYCAEPASLAPIGFWPFKQLAVLLSPPTSKRRIDRQARISYLSGRKSRSWQPLAAPLRALGESPNYADTSPRRYELNASHQKRQVNYAVSSVSTPPFCPGGLAW